jgi:Sulfotransferase family
MISFYRYLGAPERQTFKEFLTGPFQSDLWRSKYWFVCPQHEYVCDSQDRLMVDFLGKFETLQSDFRLVCEKLRMPETPVPHVNKTKPRRKLRGFLQKVFSRGDPKTMGTPPGRAECYDEECVEIVRRLYRRDIELFGYSFQRAKMTVQLSLSALILPFLDFGI